MVFSFREQLNLSKNEEALLMLVIPRESVTFREILRVRFLEYFVQLFYKHFSTSS